MAADTLRARSLLALQSTDERALLDGIDKLRSQGISQFVSLPQLVVCGDQSSGKSSVLEAISGVPFPTKDNLCTRFATELILRRTAIADVSVAIVPSPDRPESECKRLADFRETLQDFDDFSALLDRAKEAMDISSSTSAFSRDVLRVEISGPDRPHLSIVDLPGLIHSENKLQTAADVIVVSTMVQSYMANRRSIILAVVSAKNDYANQIVLKLSKEVDPKGFRTLGVITKPDTLSEGSESELGFANLARNKDVEFRLGWHVLKNRDYESRGCTTEARDLAETSFLSQGIWQELPRDLVGIVMLRNRLSKVLLEQIRAELPSLVEEIETNIQGHQQRLKRLGNSRAGLDQQRLFLLRIGQSFQMLVKAAVDGTYGDYFFGDARSFEGHSKRLRAVIQNLNLDFAEAMRTRGHRWQIIEGVSTRRASAGDETSGIVLLPERITREDLVTDIRGLLRRSRGRELPGMFSPSIVGDLFCDQSSSWKELARQHLKASWDAARTFLDLVLSHLTDETTTESLLREVIDPLMETRSKNLDEKLEELLAPYQKGHPITYNHYFTETIQNVRRRRVEVQVKRSFGTTVSGSLQDGEVARRKIEELVSELAPRNEADMDRYACFELLDCMEAYYKVISPRSHFIGISTNHVPRPTQVSMKSVVDNVAIHAVESVLVAGLEDIISPSLVMQMDPEVVSKIAGESKESRDYRVQLTRALRILEAGAATCKRYVGRSTSCKCRQYRRATGTCGLTLTALQQVARTG
ncbi:MAG: hypothetical protein M1832_001595 [Thelocarpon impressellum]|nr:MAG: hypothetical protein M1832_001595 [Thelocarpon impressellum]